MRIHLHELNDRDKEIPLTETESWVSAAVARADEKLDDHSDENPLESAGSASASASAVSTASAAFTSHREAGKPHEKLHRTIHRTIQGRMTLRKVDDVVVVSGQLKTQVQLICSRCAAPFLFRCEPQISGLFCKDPVMAGVAFLDRGGDRGEGRGTYSNRNAGKKGRGAVAKPVGQNFGIARTQTPEMHETASKSRIDSDQNWASFDGEDFDQTGFDGEADSSSEKSKDLDITYLAGNTIDLSDVLTEQLQLEIPFQPLCKESCLGVCLSCGNDLNELAAKTGEPHPHCPCQDQKKDHPFAVLKNMKGLKATTAPHTEKGTEGSKKLPLN
jgi:uncharacterized metal-binding protein YceD (DUF177 family)